MMIKLYGCRAHYINGNCPHCDVKLNELEEVGTTFIRCPECEKRIEIPKKEVDRFKEMGWL